MRLPIKIPLLLLALGLLSFQCQKEQLPLLPQSPQTPETMILGEWEWQYSVLAGYPDDTDFASPDRYVEFNFMSNDSVEIRSIHKAPDTTVAYTNFYEFGKLPAYPDSSLALQIGETKDYCYLSPDTLIVDSRYRDWSWDFYLKKPQP